jgi:hypothetical protein
VASKKKIFCTQKRYFVRITIKSYIVLINENLTNKLNSVEAKLDKLMEAPTQVFIEINTKLDAITQNLPPKTYSDATAANIVPQVATIVQQVGVEYVCHRVRVVVLSWGGGDKEVEFSINSTLSTSAMYRYDLCYKVFILFLVLMTL